MLTPYATHVAGRVQSRAVLMVGELALVPLLLLPSGAGCYHCCCAMKRILARALVSRAVGQGNNSQAGWNLSPQVPARRKQRTAAFFWVVSGEGRAACCSLYIRGRPMALAWLACLTVLRLYYTD